MCFGYMFYHFLWKVVELHEYMCQPTLAPIIPALVFCTCVTEGCVSYLSGALPEHSGWMSVCQCILLWLCLLVLYLFVKMPQMKDAHILEPSQIECRPDQELTARHRGMGISSTIIGCQASGASCCDHR